MPVTGADPILDVRGLRTEFFVDDMSFAAVNGLSFSLAAGETLGIVGESGCGKSVTALSILRLIPATIGRVAAGSVRLQGRDLMALPESEMHAIRGNEISMIFQEPMSSLNPMMTVGDQIAETLRIHQGLGRKAAFDRAVEMLVLVRMPDAARRAREYPHQLSGGMRQRVMIAIALACEPKILIADEPTTALDVTIQAQILDLIIELKERLGTAVMMISHNLGVIAETAQRAMVMYAGHKVEEAPIHDLFRSPRHPYTVGLLASIPRVGSSRSAASTGDLYEIRGMVPSLRDRPAGCPFEPRCGSATKRCAVEMPPLDDLGGSHSVSCWNPL
jgi:peptide/nickel transport system ATP-binding protein